MTILQTRKLRYRECIPLVHDRAGIWLQIERLQISYVCTVFKNNKDAGFFFMSSGVATAVSDLEGDTTSGSSSQRIRGGLGGVWREVVVGRTVSPVPRSPSFFFFLFLMSLWHEDIYIYIYIYIYFFFFWLLGLRCCTRAFSSCSKQGLLFVVVHSLLTVVASLVAEYGL